MRPVAGWQGLMEDEDATQRNATQHNNVKKEGTINARRQRLAKEGEAGSQGCEVSIGVSDFDEPKKSVPAILTTTTTTATTTSCGKRGKARNNAGSTSSNKKHDKNLARPGPSSYVDPGLLLPLRSEVKQKRDF
eukprot:jgi/Psemu1/4313/gm1.4313_g